MPHWIAAEEVPDLLRAGDRVFVAGGAAEPRYLGQALRARPQASAGVSYVGAVLPGIRASPFADLHPDARLATCMLTPGLRDLYTRGRIDLVPLPYRAIYDWLERTPFDLAMLQLAPPDARGRCALGLRVDFAPAVLPRAQRIVAEINHALPVLPGCPTIALQRIDYAVAVERPPALAPVAINDATARTIGAEIARWVRDGDCLQIGVGAIPDTALAALTEHNDLGVHSGMIAQGIAALAQRGVITGACKTIDRGRIVTGFVAGDAETYAWAASTPALVLRPVNYTHEHRVLTALDRFVAINSAIEVDLFGQVNAEMIDGVQYSGTGGALDFISGALHSRGGRSIVALPATARDGARSRIVPALARGTVATVPRSAADIFITEYGSANVRHLNTVDRALALIAIAAPQFRGPLRRAWRARLRRIRR